MSIFRSDPPPIESKERYVSVYERSARSRKLNQEAECTETIGFESMSLKSSDQFSDGMNLEIESVDFDRSVTEAIAKERTRKKRSGGERRNFPPVLTILNGNGRRRFNLTKESTGDGRLKMEMVESEEMREIVRCFRGDGRLKMELVGSVDGEDSGGGYEIGNEEFGCVTVEAEAVD